MVINRKVISLLAQTLLLAAIYFAAARLGFSLAILNKSVSPVWPPTGVAIATLLLLGYRGAAGVLLGAFISNYRLTDVGLVPALVIAVGNTLEAVTVLFLMRRFGNPLKLFDRAADLVKFLIAGAIVGPIVSATIGNTTLLIAGAEAWTSFPRLWLTWWIGDSVGALIVAPLILTWLAGPRDRWSRRRLAEMGLVVSLMILASLFVYTELFMPRTVRYPVGHVTIPLLLLAAFRFGPRGSSLATAAIASVAVWGTAHGIGPFSSADLNEGLMLLQAYLANMAVTALVLAAIVVERSHAQRKLRLNEAQLQLVTDTTPVLLTQCTRDLRYKFVNRAYAELLGLTPEQIIGRLMVDVIGNDALESIRPHIEKVLNGQATEYEHEVPYRGVGPRWLRGAYMPDRNRRGDVVGWVASISDFTDRKRTENALIESEGRLTLALSAGKMGAWEWNIQTGQVIWSSTLEEIHGSQPGTFGGTLEDFKRDVYEPDWPGIAAAIQHTLESRSEYHVTYRFRRTDGQIRWAETFGHLITGPNGQPEKLAGVSMDITERKQAEEERQHLLMREHAARAEAEAANRTKDEFLATLSHELRTPLNAVVGWAGMLRTGKLDEPNTNRAIEIIDRNAKVQSRLIEDILDVSRIVSGKVRLNVRPVELKPTIEAAVDSIQPAAESKKIRVRVTMDSTLGPIAGDPERLQQIVWNLLSNGVKFSEAGSVVDVEVRSLDSTVEIVVRDTGEGIDDKFLPFVFDRFRQADASLTRKHKGLGLGLAIVKHLVELHGGTVRAESEGEGHGATFRVQLPLLTGWSEVHLKGSPTYPADANSDNALRGLNVMIVDDEADARELLRTILLNFGAFVMESASASEALEKLNSSKADVLISDIEMPGVDGYEFVRQLRSSSSPMSREIPAIALTAHARVEDSERALAAGFHVHITKPVSPAELKNVLLDLVKATSNAVAS